MPSAVFLVLVIEKEEGVYAGYSPNISSVAAIGASREEVERSLLDQITIHLAALKSRHEANDTRVLVSTEPIEKAIACLHVINRGKPWETSCQANAQKEGLCWQHWKMLYGHEVDTRGKFRACDLCGEARPYILGNWAEPCVFKTENENWRSLLADKRSAGRAERKGLKETERRERLYASLPIQCKGERTKGGRCSNEAKKDGLCTAHWRKTFGHDYYSGETICTLCGERDYNVLSQWDTPCPSK